MPPNAESDEIVLENTVVRLAISRSSGWIVSWTERATGLSLVHGPVGLSLFEEPDPGGFLALVEENEVLLYDPFGHGGIAVQILYRLDPEANIVEVEVSLTNRTTEPIDVETTWIGLVATFEPPMFWQGGDMVPDRWSDGEFTLGGRTSVAFGVRCSAFGALATYGTEAALGWKEDEITIRVARPVADGRLFLRTASGETLETPVAADPQRALVLPLGGVAPVEALLRGPDGRALAPVAFPEPVEVPASTVPELDWPSLDESGLGLASRDPALRHLAAIERARRAAEAGKDALCEEHLETALLYGGDDPLIWWAKAGAQRRSDPQRERGEWLNARYLRPLEPLVAAEALLAQEPDGPEGENPLMRIVAGRESIAAGCVAAYVEAGAVRDAMALGARIVAVQDWRRIRAMLAGLFLSRTRMAVEAAEQWAASLRAESEGEGSPSAAERELVQVARARFGG